MFKLTFLFLECTLVIYMLNIHTIIKLDYDNVKNLTKMGTF